MQNKKISKKDNISVETQQPKVRRISKYKSVVIPGVFVDPKNDVAFKKLFGDDEHKSITINFLNSMLNLSGDEEIKKIEFLKSEVLPEHLLGKKIYLDVFCTNASDKQFIIEMQSVNEFDFIKRSQVYAARVLSSQLFKGQKYEELIPVIFLGIVDYTLFENHKDIISTYAVTNILNGEIPYQSLLTWHYVELSKFNIKIDEIDKVKTLHDKWFYFLKYANGLQAVPDKLHEFKEAFSVIEQLRWRKEDLLNYSQVDEDVAKARRQQAGAAIKAKAEGLQEGAQKKAETIAKNLLKINLSVQEIAETTGLSVEQVKKLKK